MSKTGPAPWDLPLRIFFWGAVIVLASMALQLPGAPLLGITSVVSYLALAQLAIRLTFDALDRPWLRGARDPLPLAPARRALALSRALSLRIFANGGAVLLCGIGSLPRNVEEAVRYVSMRSGAVLLALGLMVAVASLLRLRPGLRT